MTNRSQGVGKGTGTEAGNVPEQCSPDLPDYEIPRNPRPVLGGGGEEDYSSDARFVVRPIADVEAVALEERWLVESLWASEGVGIVGGTPKTGKSWAAVEIALSIASGTPAFGRFPVCEQGAVLFYPAEDRAADIRGRVDLLCRHRGLKLDGLPFFLLESDKVHLDDDDDRAALEEALSTIKPKMVVLDPLVRLHTGSESSTDHMSRVLRYLRQVQRRYSVAVMLTHHLSKKGKGGSVQHGQALRGSGDLHAWGDSNLYLTRLDGGVVELVAEHRQARPLEEPFYYRLVAEGEAAHLQEVSDPPTKQDSSSGGGGKAVVVLHQKKDGRPLEERVLEQLTGSAPVSQTLLRKALQVRNQKLTEVMHSLHASGAIERVGRGWSLVKERETQG